MDKMSPDLQGQLAAYQHVSWIRRIPFFNAKSSYERRVFTSRIALCLEAVAYSPGENLSHGFSELYLAHAYLLELVGKDKSTNRAMKPTLDADKKSMHA